MGQYADNLLYLFTFSLIQLPNIDIVVHRVNVFLLEWWKAMEGQVLAIFSEDSEVEQTLSLERDRYLDAHRFGSTPYFPFVMGIEYFLRQFRKNHPAILITDYGVESPLLFRRDREKVVKISKKKMCPNCYQFSIGDLSEAVFIGGKIEQRKSLRQNDRNNIQMAEEVMHRFDQSLYSEVLPHGPHFHNSFDIVSINESEVCAKQYGFLNDLFYIEKLKSADLAINPALMDGLLQLCAIHSIKFEKRFILPTAVKSCFINLELMKKASMAYVICRKVGECCYDIVVSNDTGKIFVEMKGMRFSPIARSVPDLAIGV